MIPLNQQYQIKRTLADRADVAANMKAIKSWVLERGGWERGGRKPNLGRSYDDALALTAIDFADADVLELGGRASFLGAYVTRWARSVHVTDLFGDPFQDWGDLAQWRELWRTAAPEPDRLTVGAADMADLSAFDAGEYDIVLCKSTIEHLPGDDDVASMREMARVLRPGGLLLLTTDTAETFRRCRGHYYDEAALYERLIEPSGCDMYGPADLSWENADKSPHRDGGFLRSCCSFVLRKQAEKGEDDGGGHMTWWDGLRALWMPGDRIEPTEARRRYYHAKRRVVGRVRPTFIAEIGVRAGYSAWAMLDAAGPDCRYWGIDLDQGTHGGIPGALDHARQILAPWGADIVVGDSGELDRLPEGVDLLHIDGDHSYEGCASDLRLAARSGVRWVLIDDTDYIPDVRRAVEAFADAPEWIHDGHRGMALVRLQ